MGKVYLVSIPTNITRTKTGIEFYDKVQIVECKAYNLREIYYQYPNALKVELKDNQSKEII